MKNFVTFYSPGTFMSEMTEKEISSWDIEEAKSMARNIKERHAATPYGFRFETREMNIATWEQKTVKSSPMYYLGGNVLTLEDVKARKDPKDKTLIWNMEANNFDRVIENTNSWKITLPLNKEDIVLEWK